MFLLVRLNWLREAAYGPGSQAGTDAVCCETAGRAPRGCPPCRPPGFRPRRWHASPGWPGCHLAPAWILFKRSCCSFHVWLRLMRTKVGREAVHARRQARDRRAGKGKRGWGAPPPPCLHKVHLLAAVQQRLGSPAHCLGCTQHGAFRVPARHEGKGAAGIPRATGTGDWGTLQMWMQLLIYS